MMNKKVSEGSPKLPFPFFVNWRNGDFNITSLLTQLLLGFCALGVWGESLKLCF
uniref:Uncharacterized protein n=1 Tax=Cucumis sativus TaxID=3659 RepID=A0A0A0LYZ7_CUCSA